MADFTVTAEVVLEETKVLLLLESGVWPQFRDVPTIILIPERGK